jgi:hypothetical protein
VSRPHLSDRAGALSWWVGLRRVTYDAAWVEFVHRRDWYPEDFYAALGEAVDAEVLRRNGDELRGVRP